MCLRKFILWIALPLFACTQAGRGQYTYVLDGFDYIRNGDLEDYHDSPYSSIYVYPKHWVFGHNSPDYYHVLHNFPWSPKPSRGVPYNSFGYQWPRSGDGYASFIIEYYVSTSGTDYSAMEIFSNELAEPLEPGRYLVTFYYVNGYFEFSNVEFPYPPIASVDSIYVSLNSLGETPIPFPNSDTKYYEQFLPAFGLPVVQDTMDWQKAEVIVTAQGGELNFSVGTFTHPSEITPNYISTHIEHDRWWVAIYYLDDFSMYRIIDSIPVADSVGVTNVTLYPNPSPNGQFTLEYAVHEDAQPVFSMYDATGRLVGRQSLPGGQQRVPLDYGYLASGVYLWRLEQNGAFVGGGKATVMQ